MKPMAVFLALFLIPAFCGITSAQEVKTSSESVKKKEPQDAEAAQAIEDLEKELKAVKEQAEASRPGSTKFLLTGYGFAGAEDHQGEASTFFAGFNPIFLWRLSDRILFEGELEVELEGTGTEVALEYADVSYVLNDYVILRAGKFLTPLSKFKETLHPAWINKLPTQPLFATGSTRLIPTSSLGFEVRGAFPAGGTKFNYAVYVSNGPRLNTTGANAGTLAFKNFEDLNNGKAVGARLGFLPIPQLELGYAFKAARVGAEETPFSDVNARIQAADLSYARSSEVLRGTVDLRAEWIWSKVDDATYGSFRFDNTRNGGYLQLAYRPSLVHKTMIKNLEAVVRYDALDLPTGAPIQIDQKRVTLGLIYWLGSSTALKGAYQSNRKEEPGAGSERERAFLFQLGIGF